MSDLYVDLYGDIYSEVSLGDLQIGRVGLETDLHNPYEINRQSSATGEVVSIRGHIKETTSLAQAKHLRREMISQVNNSLRGEIIAIKSAIDPDIDGFYRLVSADVEATAKLASLQSVGFFPFTVRLERIESVAFQSSLSGVLIPNDHAVSSAVGFSSLPASVTSVYPSATRIDRFSDEGQIPTLIWDGYTAATLPSPVWTCPPDGYYLGAARLHVNGELLSGTHTIDNPSSWRLSNGIIDMVPVVTSVTKFRMRGVGTGNWDSADETLALRLITPLTGEAEVDAWDHLVVLRNDPEVVSIRLVAGAKTALTSGRFAVDFTLRRGSRFFVATVNTTDATNIKWRANTSETAGTPMTNLTWGMRHTNHTGLNEYFIMGSRTSVNVNIGASYWIGKNSTRLDVFLGWGNQFNTPPPGESVDEIFEQYLFDIREEVTPVRVSGGTAV